MSARFGFRAAQALRHPTLRQHINSNIKFAQRRVQSTTSEVAETVKQSEFSKFFNSPVGPKTVHFWAPVMKWGLVIAGAADFARPADQLSLTQNSALMATGLIWTRWCFVIRPRNIFLASVNFLLFVVGAVQCSRVLIWQSSQKSDTITDKAGQAVEKVKEAVKPN